MRTTQFIGLTQAAEDFVKDLKELPSDTNFCPSIQSITFGMFEEEIPLRRWETRSPFTNREKACIREKLQMSPWSSGPMLFTCLEVDFGNEGSAEIFQWICDPTVEGEYDQTTGRLWV